MFLRIYPGIELSNENLESSEGDYRNVSFLNISETQISFLIQKYWYTIYRHTYIRTFIDALSMIAIFVKNFKCLSIRDWLYDYGTSI